MSEEKRKMIAGELYYLATQRFAPIACAPDSCCTVIIIPPRMTRNNVSIFWPSCSLAPAMRISSQAFAATMVIIFFSAPVFTPILTA